ncbi:MAG: hypothetical protein ACFCVD_20820 [Nodosilinea sp.]
MALASAAPMTVAQTTELDEFCSRYPENSRCENYAPNPSDPEESLDRSNRQLIRVQLNTTGPDDEFVWIALQRDEVNRATELTAYSSHRLDSFLNQFIGQAVPLPIDVFKIYNFQDQQTAYLSFTSDACQSQPQLGNGGGLQEADCAITGNGAITLPEDVDIRAGFFTLGYTDNDLVKAVIFRLEDQEAAFVDEADLDNLCQNFPLNSRCRFWPLTSSSSSATRP